EKHPALTQRYRGSVRGSTWHIDATYPALTRPAMAEALVLGDLADTDGARYPLRDEAEAEAILTAARHDPNLCLKKFHREGLMIGCEFDPVGHLVNLIFRLRFRGLWDVASVERELAEKIRQQVEMQRAMRRAGAEAAR